MKYFITSILGLLFLVSNLQTAASIAKSDNCLKTAQSSRSTLFEKRINEVLASGLTDKEKIFALEKHGEVGCLVAAHLSYILSLEKGTPNRGGYLEKRMLAVPKYILIRLLSTKSDRIGGLEYRRLLQRLITLNKQYRIFPEDDPFYNLVQYVGNVRVADDMFAKWELVKNLRYFAFLSSGHRENYVKRLAKLKGFAFNKELAYWQKRAGQQICLDGLTQEKCSRLIKKQIQLADEEYLNKLYGELACKLTVLYEGNSLRFNVCSK